MTETDRIKKILFDAADVSSGILLSHLGKKIEISRKLEYTDLVTEVDKKSEAKIIEVIHSEFPEHNILSEECGDLSKESDFVWIIDPVDGTINYAHSVPIFCISIAVQYKHEIILGLVYNPLSGEKFFAEQNKGASLNGKRIKVSDTRNLKDSLLVTGFPYGAKDNIDHCIDHFVNFVKEGLPIRRLGSAAIDICYVACGKFDGFWEVSLNPWDVAAGYLILREAGGKLSNFSGEAYSVYSKQIIASNGLIHDEMIQVLQRAYKN